MAGGIASRVQHNMVGGTKPHSKRSSVSPKFRMTVSRFRSLSGAAATADNHGFALAAKPGKSQG
jgi:hypothetical protein